MRAQIEIFALLPGVVDAALMPDGCIMAIVEEEATIQTLEPVRTYLLTLDRPSLFLTKDLELFFAMESGWQFDYL